MTDPYTDPPSTADPGQDNDWHLPAELEFVKSDTDTEPDHDDEPDHEGS